MMLTWDFKTTFVKFSCFIQQEKLAIGREDKQVLYVAELQHAISKENFSRIREWRVSQ